MGVPEDMPEYSVLQNLGLDSDARGIFNLAVALDVYNNLKGLSGLQQATVKGQMDSTYKRIRAL